MSTSIRIDLGERSYEIKIGPGLISDVSAFKSLGVSKRSVYIITDENVSADYSAKLENTFISAGSGPVHILELPPGEHTKSFSYLEKILNWLLEHKADRKSLVVALGGGVIGDIAGLAASLLMRGVSYVQVPTTLLAQIDSSIGGKTAIDTKYGKNLVGAFYQPSAVFADVNVLAGLPARQLCAGYAEGVKHAVIKDRKFFKWLQKNYINVLSLNPEAMAYFVEHNCQIKADVVQDDEKEKKGRALLNFGHTFGHALEVACGYDVSLLHGEAISIGMVLAFELSRNKGYCPEDDVDMLTEHLKTVGLPVSIRDIDPPIATSADSLLNFMKGDKKTLSGNIQFILTRGIGKAFITSDVENDLVKRVIKESMDGPG
jgi:3-dehydroquinate synthase